jgi:uncharacterized protein (TIGR02145 family)
MSRLVVIVLGLCAHLIPVLATAQLREFDITPVQSNRIPVFRDHPEMAAVIVNSSLTNLRFDSNLEIVAMLGNPNQGEYILIVRPNRQIITVNAPGFQQGRVTIAPTEPRQVLYYRVEPKEAVATNIIPTNFLITPADARVTVDGTPVDVSKPVPIEIGTHRIRIEKSGYRTIEKEIRISAEQNFIRETLTPIEPVPLTIRTQPAGATVLIDGVQAGVTDRNGTLQMFRFPGSYALTVQANGFLASESRFTMTEAGPNTVSVTLERNSGTLRLTVTPSDATVLLNRQPQSAVGPIELAPGMVRIEVSKDGFEPFAETVEIVRNQTLTRTVSLRAFLGGLQITTTPSDAAWTLTDAAGRIAASGTGLARKTDIPVGTYTLTTRSAGYRDAVESVRIERDAVAIRAVALVESAPAAAAASPTRSLPCGSPITDIDGNSYKTVQIGNQCWMAENLRTSKYRDGTPIPNVTGTSQWGSLTTGAWAHYDNQAANETRYGKLYNWYAVADSRNVCLVGWHVPTDAEWTVLGNHLGSEPGHKMKATSGWNNRGNGSNASGFNGLPGGSRYADGAFNNVGRGGYFWSSSEASSGVAWNRGLNGGNRDLGRGNVNERGGFSVRCLRD